MFTSETECNTDERQYIELVKKNGLALQSIPEDKRTPNVCLAAVEQNGWALQFVPEDKRTSKICIEAVKQNDLALQLILPDKRTPAICLAAVQQNGRAIKLVPDDKLTIDICQAAVESDGNMLRYVPHDMCTPGVCLAAIRQNGKALMYVPKDKRTDEFYLVAVSQNGKALEQVPLDKHNIPELFLTAVQQDGRALTHVPKDKRTDELYFAAVSRTGRVLELVPKGKRTPALCLAAVKENPEALEFVPQHMKADIIRTVTVKTILENNYLAVKYFPKQPDFSGEINSILATAERIVVAKPSTDHEIRDAQLMYTRKKEHVVSILCDSNPKSQLSLLLNHLEEAKNANMLRLKLIGHANENAHELARLHYNDVNQIREKHPQIERMTFVGCNTAKSKKTSKEIEMATRLKAKSEYRYGLVSTLQAPHNNANFQEKCQTFCKNNNLAGVYVLSKTEAGDYELFSMKYDKQSNIIREKIKNVCKTQEMKNILEAHKPMHFPKTKDSLLPIRDKNRILKFKELSALRNIAAPEEKAKRFDETHSKYKDDKEKYAFLATCETDPKKLSRSFMKKVVDKMQMNTAIKGKITLKGATKALHVDTAQRNFIVARSHLYKRPYNQSLFSHPEVQMINYDKLQKEREKEIQDMQSDDYPTKPSMAKYIKVTLVK